MNNLRPSASFCFGREKLRQEVLDGALSHGAALLFGGTRSGKRTFIRWLVDNWSTADISSGGSGELNIAVLLDLENTPRLSSAESFYSSLRDRLASELSTRVRQPWSLPLAAEVVGATSSQAFASLLDSVILAFPNRTATFLFIVHKAERLFDWSFDEQFFRNLLTIPRDRTYPNAATVALLLSGGPRFYSLCDDQGGSCLGTIARRPCLENLTIPAVESMLRHLDHSGRVSNTGKVAQLVHKLLGGQPALSREIAHLLVDSGETNPKPKRLKELAARIFSANGTLFKAWQDGLSEEARIAMGILRSKPRITEREISGKLASPHHALRAKQELAFTGIAVVEPNGDLSRVIPHFWERLGVRAFRSKSVPPTEPFSFQFHWTDGAIHRPGKKPVTVPPRFCSVLRFLLEEIRVESDDGPSSRSQHNNVELRFRATYAEVAKTWEEGRSLEELATKKKESDKRFATDFKSEFGYWARKELFAGQNYTDYVIKHDSLIGGYKLGEGWAAPPKTVIGRNRPRESTSLDMR